MFRVLFLPSDTLARSDFARSKATERLDKPRPLSFVSTWQTIREFLPARRYA